MNMKRRTSFFTVVVIAFFCLIACDKYNYEQYIVEGRIIDRNTREPVEYIIISFHKYDILNPPKNVQKIQKREPIGHDGLSDANGKFNVLEKYSTSLLYIYDYYGVYKDTIISVDFSNITLSGTPHRYYKGDYILNIGDVELEKIK